MSDPTYVQEYKAIVDVLNQYNEGGAKADSALMKPAFNAQATMFGVDGDKLVGGAIQNLYDVIDNAFRPSPRPARQSCVLISSAPQPVPGSTPTTYPDFASPTSSTC